MSAAIAGPLIIGLLGRVSSLKPDSTSGKTFEELTQEYSRWEQLGAVLYIIVTVLIAFVLWKGLDLFYQIVVSFVEPSEFLIMQPSITWALPAMFLSMFISVVPLHHLFLALMGSHRYAEYTEYGSRKLGFDSWKLMRHLAYIIVPACMAFIILSLDSYARVTNSGFVVNRFFGLGESRYRFDDLRTIELTRSFKAPNGKIVRDPYYSIGFGDGTEYDFHSAMHDQSIDQQQQIANYLSWYSRTQIVVNDPYPR